MKFVLKNLGVNFLTYRRFILHLNAKPLTNSEYLKICTNSLLNIS